ncbi:MAG: PilW family protein [Pseudomonadota bacterium]
MNVNGKPSLKLLHSLHSSTSQRGLTLVELMVSLILGLIILAGVIQIFVGTLKTSRMNLELNLVQENGRLALSVLERALRKAGWTESTDPSDVFYTLDNNVLFLGDLQADGNVPELVSENDITKNLSGSVFVYARVSDRLVTQHQGDEDCLGNLVNSGNTGIVVNSYFVQDADGIPALFCKGNASPKAEMLVPFVESMHLLYGVDVMGDESSLQYFNATNIIDSSKAPTDATRKIIAAKLALVVRSDTQVQMQEKKQIALLDQVASNSHYGDKRLRQVFSKTIFLPNRTY